MTVPYEVQLLQKQRMLASQITNAPDLRWSEPFQSRESGFRNKAKLVVGGTSDHPTLGILDSRGHGVDLSHCGLYESGLATAFPMLAEFIRVARLVPYDVPNRSGELKYLLLTYSPGGELMLRFVLRSQSQLARIRSQLGKLRSLIPQLRVISANIQPEHKAILEGDTEFLLTDEDTLAMQVNDVTLYLRPGSFFQTNTAVAAALYRQARSWVDSTAPTTIADLYCGVGGFALHCDAPGRMVTGVEIIADAITSARQSSQSLTSTAKWDFRVGDASIVPFADSAPEVVIVNPPRRGIGGALATIINQSSTQTVLYSSCNVQSLAKDLARLSRFEPIHARLFDMFPQTHHHEVMLLLQAR